MTSILRTLVVGGVLGAGVVSGGALALAQTGTSVPPADGSTAGTTPGTAPGTVPGTTGGTMPGTAPPAAEPAPPGEEAAPPQDGQDCDRAGDGGHGRHGRGGRGAHLGASLDDLAAELGVAADRLREASQAARQAVRDQRDQSEPGADRAAAADLYLRTLADSLGVTTERLRDAGMAVLSRRLDEAVAAGRMTRQQAEDLLARAREHPDAGLGLGGPGLGGRGGRRGGPAGPGDGGTGS